MNLLNKLTLKNLKLNKKRTIVTIIGITLSVALITAVAAMFLSARASIIKYEIKEKGNYHYVYYNIPKNDIDFFKVNRNFENIYYTKNIGYSILKESKNKNKPYVFIKAFDSNALENLAINIISGRLPENDSEILIPSHLKTNGRVEYKIGDTLNLEIGKRMNVKEDFEMDQSYPYEGENLEKIIDTVKKEYKIVGTIERPIYTVEEYSAPGYTFVTYLDNKNITGNVDIYTRYTKEALKNDNVVTAKILDVNVDAFTFLYYGEEYGQSGADMEPDAVKQQFEKMGKPKYKYENNYYLIKLERGIFKENSMKSLGIVAAVVVIIIIFTSVFCIKNSFNISITEKIKQYGMLSSVGATSKQIKKNVYYEALILGIIGIPMGIICGLLASFVLIELSDFLIGSSFKVDLIYSFSWLSILFAAILGLVTLYLSAWKSARIASKITPITAIRNSENIKINPKKIKSPKYIKKIFGIGGDVSYKNLKRNKKKYRATVISIIVCSSVFIALSAFINLAFEYVQKEYETTDYNLQLLYDLNNGITTKAKEIINFDNIDNYSVWSSEYITQFNNKLKFSKEYLEVFPDIIEKHSYKTQDGKEVEEYSSTGIQVYRIGDYAYKKYLQELNLKEDETKNKGILIDIIEIGLTDKSGKFKRIKMSNFDYKKGDKLNFFKYSYELDENGNNIPVDINIELAEVTTKHPFGIPNYKHQPVLILSDELYNKIFTEEYQRSETETISIYTKDATKLQDQIDEYLNAYSDDYSLTNVEENVRAMKSFYLLVAIFLYGFITVIALIGITNIFNTITTNMELRSREFATLKSIGMTHKEFNRMIFLESFFYGTKSLIIGIPIGSILAYIIHKILTEGDTTATFNLPTNSILIATLAVFVLITFIMKYSINKINKQNTIETIRNENI